VGDSLGAPVEFLRIPEIRAKYGPEGIQELVPYFWGLGAWTDDTQMSLFTAEGLIQAHVRGGADVPGVMALAFQRWFCTQGEPCHPSAIEDGSRGWLVDIEGLHRRRAPGNTCLSSLQAWRPNKKAVNDSKGCGTVMRSAAFGFLSNSWEDAWSCAEITHGHLEGAASAAILAETVRLLVEGLPMEEALQAACRLDKQGTQSASLVRRAIELAKSSTASEEAIRELGGGWVADEALGIAAYCAVKAGSDFAKAVRLAVNHDGDSDSTGAITGNLVGTAYGVDAVPERWLDVIELREVLEQVAADLVAVIPGGSGQGALDAERALWDRYPR